MNSALHKLAPLLVVCVLMLAWVGCGNMREQPKLEAYEATDILPGGTAAQRPPEHTLTFAATAVPEAIESGRRDGAFVAEVPTAMDRRSLEHGQTLFNAHCAPCHGYTGHGDGIVVRRGFPEPPSFHTDRLRRAPAGYLYTVLNEGYGVMLPYGQRISRDERWRVIAYLRTLQLTQYATAEHVPRRIWASLAEEQEETQ